TYQTDWSRNNEFKQWICEGADSSQHAKCTRCQKTFSIAGGDVRDAHSHASSAKHTAIGLFLAQAKKTEDLETVANKKKITESELKLMNFIVKRNQPIRLVDNIPDNVADWFPDSKIAKAMSCRQTKASTMVKNVTGKVTKQDLCDKLQSCNFTLLVDKSTDKKMALVAIYFDEELDKVQYRFYCLVDLKEATADSIFSAILSSLEEDSVPVGNVMALGTDGANIMLGARNSVLSQFRTVQPNIFHIHCICHVAALCVADACKAFPKTVEQLCRDIHSHFSISNKRLQLLEEFQGFVEADSLKLLELCSNRWLSLLDCVDRILNQYDALLSYFQSSDESDRLATAERSCHQLEDPSTKCYFLFLQAALPLFTNFNHFQSNSPILPALYPEVQQLLKAIMGQHIAPQALTPLHDYELQDFDHQEELNFKLPDSIYIDSQTRIQLEKVDNPAKVKKLMDAVIAFYVNGVSAIKKRMPLGNEVLKLTSILQPSKFSDIVQLAKSFPQTVPSSSWDNLEAEFIEYQVADLSNVNSGQPLDVYWHQLGQITTSTKDHKFSVLSKFATLLALPHSTAEVERLFSAVNLTKTDLRNKLSTSMLECLL
uniref:HAT C-terminal dimerisation domain-containing protein n=1 Tax=Latimeria chalumnae TaxID=7897 RepID=H3AIF5_LATCH